jgi:hypothetical protein
MTTQNIICQRAITLLYDEVKDLSFRIYSHDREILHFHRYDSSP